MQGVLFCKQLAASVVMTAAAAAKDKNQDDNPAAAAVTSETSESTHKCHLLENMLEIVFLLSLHTMRRCEFGEKKFENT